MLPVKLQNGAAAFKNSLANPQNVRHIHHRIQQFHSLKFHNLREMQTYVHINNLNMHVIHDSPKQETTQMSLSW